MSTTNPDITEDITESSLPSAFFKKRPTADHTINENTCDDTNNTQIEDDSTTTLMEKEGKLDNIWRSINTLHDICTQRNYSRAVNKRTLDEVDRFEEGVEKWVR